MAVKIGSARSDERGKITGGKAGDQKSGKEVSTQNYYVHSKGWRVLRAKDAAKRKLIAQAMEAACANNNIGYDQYQRNTLYYRAQAYNFDPSKVVSACETDCSALVRVCCAFAGINTKDFNTSTEAKVLLASGAFEELTDSKYTKKSDYLMAGDILVTKTKGHTVIVLTDGDKAEKEESVKPAGKQVVATGDKVNIRTGPGTNYTIIHTADKGEKFPLVDEGNWRPLKYGGHVYWISGNYSKVEG